MFFVFQTNDNTLDLFLREIIRFVYAFKATAERIYKLNPEGYNRPQTGFLFDVEDRLPGHLSIELILNPS